MSDLTKWMPPNIYTFCSRCGKVCRAGSKDFMCVNCEVGMFDNGVMTDAKHRDAEIEGRISDQLKAVRMQSAQSLKDHQIPELYWMKT